MTLKSLSIIIVFKFLRDRRHHDQTDSKLASLHALAHQVKSEVF